MFTPSNDVSDLNIHTFPMVMKTEKDISMLNSKLSKFLVYLLNKSKPFVWWRNHYVTFR